MEEIKLVPILIKGMTGKIVLVRKMNASNEVTVDVNHLVNGSYSINVTCIGVNWTGKFGVNWTGKFVKH